MTVPGLILPAPAYKAGWSRRRVLGVSSGKPGLVIEVTRLAYNGESYELSSNQYSKQGSSRTTRAAATIGGGAGVGALIGGILGGGRGAAIGAMIGAGQAPGSKQRQSRRKFSFRLKPC